MHQPRGRTTLENDDDAEGENMGRSTIRVRGGDRESGGKATRRAEARSGRGRQATDTGKTVERAWNADVRPRGTGAAASGKRMSDGAQAPTRSRTRVMFAYVDVPRLSASRLAEYKIMDSASVAVVRKVANVPKTADGPEALRRSSRPASPTKTKSLKRKERADEADTPREGTRSDDRSSAADGGSRARMKRGRRRLIGDGQEEGDRAIGQTAKGTANEFGDAGAGGYVAERKGSTPISRAKGRRQITVRVACHQCRRRKDGPAMICRGCRKIYCDTCVVRRYDFPCVPGDDSWACPHCQGYCNCDVCMADRGTWKRLCALLGRNEEGTKVRLGDVAWKEGVSAQTWLRMSGFRAEGGSRGGEDDGCAAISDDDDADGLSVELGVPPSPSEWEGKTEGTNEKGASESDTPSAATCGEDAAGTSAQRQQASLEGVDTAVHPPAKTDSIPAWAASAGDPGSGRWGDAPRESRAPLEMDGSRDPPAKDDAGAVDGAGDGGEQAAVTEGGPELSAESQWAALLGGSAGGGGSWGWAAQEEEDEESAKRPFAAFPESMDTDEEYGRFLVEYDDINARIAGQSLEMESVEGVDGG